MTPFANHLFCETMTHAIYLPGGPGLWLQRGDRGGSGRWRPRRAGGQVAATGGQGGHAGDLAGEAGQAGSAGANGGHAGAAGSSNGGAGGAAFPACPKISECGFLASPTCCQGCVVEGDGGASNGFVTAICKTTAAANPIFSSPGPDYCLPDTVAAKNCP